MFSWAASKCKSVARSVVNGAKYVVDSIKNSSIVDSAKRACAKVWNAFTGKSYADEAESILDEVKVKYEKAESDYKDKIGEFGTEIENKISHINTRKKEIYDVHFKRFISVANRMHNVVVKGIPFEELFDDKILEVQNIQGVRSKKELIPIDFNNLSFLQTAGMILTLGFSTRKVAKKSLEDAKQERKRVEEEMQKMQSQMTKLKVVVESIEQVASYFDTLINSYVILLDRFEYGIQTQRVKQMALASNVFDLRLDFKQVPIVHIEEFQALFNLSIILKQMSTLGYLSEQGEVVKKDIATSKFMFNQVQAAALCA
jgi:uncharacterized FlaG/YvyC family protein